MGLGVHPHFGSGIPVFVWGFGDPHFGSGIPESVWGLFVIHIPILIRGSLFWYGDSGIPKSVLGRIPILVRGSPFWYGDSGIPILVRGSLNRFGDSFYVHPHFAMGIPVLV